MPSKKTTKNALKRINDSVEKACRKNPLFSDGSLVFGEGPAPAKLMIVGEAPGRTETREKKPFVGKAGAYFTSILEEELGLKRERIYITNVVKVWPKIDTPRGRTRAPSAAEEAFFLPYLMKEIAAVEPVVIIAVGKTAFKALVPERAFKPNRWVETEGLRIMPVYHPAYLQRRRRSMAELEEELRAALKEVAALIKPRRRRRRRRRSEKKQREGSSD
ncbi:MAG TPA: uracil-DNA glycosylase [Deltaproteobacteria bacterium]|nr:uracil-DNA glycosylase [Deltaproteobacteria bacterium]